jgi:tRNA U34 5-carboxymethylaminomethyl modifying enzyme MnmG/GidA
LARRGVSGDIIHGAASLACSGRHAPSIEDKIVRFAD